jgi:hypothetical protein
MFVRFDPDWPPLDPPQPEPTPPARRLDEAQQKRLMQALGVNAVLLLVAPIGGATLIGGLLRWLG